MRKIFILLISVLIVSCTPRGELINRAYLKVDRYDGISKLEAIAIAEYYFSYKQSVFKKSNSVHVDRNPDELKDNWKFRVVSTIPNVDIYVSYLVNKKDGQIVETDDRPIK